MHPDSKSAIEQTRNEALEAISKIPLRSRPKNVKPYAFSEEFTSDVADVLRFCRNRSPYARNPLYIERKHEAIFYMTDPFYRFYLPGILFTALEFPQGHVAWFLIRTLHRKQASFAREESAAAQQVMRYLALHGITPESIEEKVQRRRRRYERYRQLIESGLSNEEACDILREEC